MIKIVNLHKNFRRKEALKGIDLQLENGVYGLLGPNGAGKTTLIRCMTKLYDYKRGEIFIDGQNIMRQTGHVMNIGYLPQQFGTYKELTVLEAMEFFCVLKNIDKEEGKEQTNRALEKVKLEEHGKDKVKVLSGGMLRRLGIAQTLLGNPKVLIFDEPTAGLDPEERLRFKRIVADVAKDRIVLISTHIVEDVEALCNKIIVMNEGMVLKMGTSDEISGRAAGKVYQCRAAETNVLDKALFIEKEYEKAGEVFYRILSGSPLPIEPLTATIEDGYLCILKNI